MTDMPIRTYRERLSRGLDNFHINGADLHKALESLGGDEAVLLDILRVYAISVPSMLKELGEFLESGNLGGYATTIHGMKSSSYAIFAQETGRMAELLEDAAEAGNYKGIRKKHQAFTDMAVILLEEINKLLDQAASVEKPEAAESDPFQLQELRDASKAFDAAARLADFTAPNARLLIADDSEISQKIAQGLIKPLKMRIDTAENGKEALRMIRYKQYHIILMDHMMPEMDGIEATGRLRRAGEDLKTLPVVALIAGKSGGAREQFLQAGASDILTKPFEKEELYAVIRKWLPVHLRIDNAHVETEEAQAPDLPPLEGINVKEGIRLTGSKELYTRLLKDVYRLIDLKTSKIERCLANGMLWEVAIEAHALGGIAKIMGADELAEGFDRLEAHGKEGNREGLEREAPIVLTQLRSFKPLLKTFDQENPKKKEAPRKELIALLRKLEASIKLFDKDGADEVLNQIEEYTLPAWCEEQMELLKAQMADVALVEIAALTEVMIEIIETKC